MINEFAKHTEKLYYFFEVAEAGSLMASSRKLGVSAPAISYTIKQLELVINIKLFLRSKQGMSLTLAGEHLHTFCKKYFQDLDNLLLVMKNPKEKPITRVKMGTFQSIAIYFWPLLLDRMKKKPDISLSIQTNRSHIIIESLINRRIDIALTVEGQQHKDLIRHELYTDEYCTYLSSDFNQKKLSINQIKNMTLMYIPDAIDKEGITLKQRLYMTDLPLKEIFEFDSFEAIAEFVKRGFGLGILPKRVAGNYGSSLQEVRLGGKIQKFGSHRFFFSYRNDLELSQSLMNLFLNSARDAVMDMSIFNDKHSS